MRNNEEEAGHETRGRYNKEGERRPDMPGQHMCA